MIGRGEKSGTRLTDGTVSRLHCELKWEGTKFTLIDLDSVGGTFVGGQKIKEHALKHDEEFQIGGTPAEAAHHGNRRRPDLAGGARSRARAQARRGRPDRQDDLALRARADAGQGTHRHHLQGPRHPRRQGRRLQGPPRRLHQRRGGRSAVHPRHDHRRRAAPPQPDRPLRRRQAGLRPAGSPWNMSTASRSPSSSRSSAP